ncbi:Tyrosine recombinase XerC [Listeria monocytogenes]|nr:Tyrosine recombinase XerC [Listeria monocytogenes]
MTTIFPKEQNVTPLFEQILANPTACRRFKDVFLDNLESYQETRGFEKDDTLFAKIILSAYRQSDVSALLLGVCGRTLFELLRQAFLIPKKLTVDNPFFLTDKEGNFIAKKDDISNREQEKFQEIYQSDLHHSETTIFLVDDDDIVHSYEPDFSISTKRINKKRGIMTESEVYAFIWKTFLHIQEIIPSSRILDKKHQKMQMNLAYFFQFTILRKKCCKISSKLMS